VCLCDLIAINNVTSSSLPMAAVMRSLILFVLFFVFVSQWGNIHFGREQLSLFISFSFGLLESDLIQCLQHYLAFILNTF